MGKRVSKKRDVQSGVNEQSPSQQEVLAVSIERLQPDYEEALYKYIDQLFTSTWTDPELREQKQRELDAYRQSRRAASTASGQSGKILRVTYGPEGLAPLLRIGDLTLSTLFDDVFADLIAQKRAAVGFPVVKASLLSEDERELRDICDGMDNDLLVKVQDLAASMSPSFWQTPEAQTWSPTDRAIEISKRKLQWSDRLALTPPELATPGFINVKKDQHRYMRIPVEDFPAIANYFHVSFHWLMMGDDTITATAKKPGTEFVLTAYMFMSPSVKKLFLQAVRNAAHIFRYSGEV